MQDSDYGTRTPRKPFGANLAPLGSGMAAGGFLPGDLAAAGTPSNLGRIGDAGLSNRLLFPKSCPDQLSIQRLQILILWV